MHCPPCDTHIKINSLLLLKTLISIRFPNLISGQTTCSRIWSFDIHPNGHLNNPSNSKQKQLTTVSLEECLNECANHTLDFKCRSVNYDSRKLQCTLNQHNRRIVPEAYTTENQFTSSMDNLVYAENHCVPCE